MAGKDLPALYLKNFANKKELRLDTVEKKKLKQLTQS